MAAKAVRTKARATLQKVAAVALLALYCQEAALAAVIFEQDFEDLSNCSTGREDQCWIDNGFASGDNSDFHAGTIRSDGGPIGNGYMQIQLPFGGVSAGRATIDTTDASELRWGMFVKFTNDYMFYSQTHGLGARVTGSAGCDLGGNLEMGNDPAYYMFNNGSCGFSNAIDLTANQTGRTTLKGGRWYWIEQYMKIDTSCTDSTSQTGCNGEYRLWVDEVLVAEHTNRNFAGVTRSAQLSGFAYEWYFHVGMPGQWGDTPMAMVDNLIIRNDNVEIGIPEGATQGTARPTPYFLWHAANNFIAHQFNDCSAPDFASRRVFNYGSVWRSGSATVTQATSSPLGNNEYPPDPTQCPTQAAETDAYMKIAATTGQGGGAGFDVARYYTGTGSASFYQNWTINGWIYLPAGNDYSNVLLSGFRRYNCYSGCCDGSCAPWGRVIAMTVEDGNWSIAYRNDTATTTYHTGTTAITEDAWVEYELWHNYADEFVQLKINGVAAAYADLAGQTQDIMQHQDGGVVVGVIDYRGTGTFNASFDDTSLGTASFTSCDAWDGIDCPFGDGPEPTPEEGGGPFAGVCI